MQKRMPVRKDREGVSPVIATILMVAITVVLAAVLYVMVSGLISGPGTSKPQVTTSQTGYGCSLSASPRKCEAAIASASPAADLGQYKVTLFVNGTQTGTAQPLTTSAITLGTYTFRYTDVGGNGKLKGGDIMKLTTVVPSTTYKLVFLWTQDSSQVFDVTLQT